MIQIFPNFPETKDNLLTSKMDKLAWLVQVQKLIPEEI
jgi:hypothetical protein